ncbi:hypothetical protein M438DRAFT_75423 [Aureobasidium pullulans EXF-150]|uniref:Uncharacterized protein n=1 Tax=Aureobasidium pullulans EXF-150 TaxID=1043002 RepID=A0A074X7P4_AURPU|nr:uncharacterized protein M438DRAFT_75423 [Aureobasidium pullulans EXF-150]KEQ81545.1 hypothetical protein M438DRAFT_75423 [Aureobasidium pullulans EXF-150]
MMSLSKRGRCFYQLLAPAPSVYGRDRWWWLRYWLALSVQRAARLAGSLTCPSQQTSTVLDQRSKCRKCRIKGQKLLSVSSGVKD